MWRSFRAEKVACVEFYISNPKFYISTFSESNVMHLHQMTVAEESLEVMPRGEDLSYVDDSDEILDICDLEEEFVREPDAWAELFKQIDSTYVLSKDPAYQKLLKGFEDLRRELERRCCRT